MTGKFERDGYIIITKAIDPQIIDPLRESIEELRRSHTFSGGLRRLAHLSKPIGKFISKGSLQSILDSIGLPNAFLVRSILRNFIAQVS